MESVVLKFESGVIPPAFWSDAPESDAPSFLLNPKVPSVELPQGVEVPFKGLICFATSGSTGVPKWIAHTRETLLASAASVNQFLTADQQDVWLRALPLFHVGGFGIEARAWLAGSRVAVVEGKWNAADFHQAVETQHITLASLVPTQVFDLVSAKVHCPQSMRAVIVGGGRLDAELKKQAKALGWPVLESYGMTEAGSQIATENASGELELLGVWEARETDCLEVRGTPLAKGMFAKGSDEKWQFHPFDEWHRTNDRVAIRGRNVKWLGRSDRVVKVLGELVDLDAMEAECCFLAGHEIVILAIPDERLGSRLVASEMVSAYQKVCAPFARIQGTFDPSLLTRSPLGKVLRQETTQKVSSS